MPATQKTVDEQCGVFETLETHRKVVIEPLWSDISYLVMPDRSTEHRRTPGQDRSIRTYDNTAQIAATRLHAALSGMLTSPTVEWFSLQPNDPSADDEDSAVWREQARQQCYSVFRSSSSGLASALSECYMDLSGFGTCAMFIDTNNLFRYHALPLVEVFIAQNANGRIDTMYRSKMFTASQAADLFGANNLSESVQKDLNSPSRYTVEKEYLHIVGPREVDSTKFNFAQNKPFFSIWVERDSKHLLSEGGFDEFPFAVARWRVSSGKTYGTSPGIDVIDEIRMVNAMAKTSLVASEKAANIPLMVLDDSVLGGGGQVRVNAGGITYIRPGQDIRPMPIGDPRIADERIEQVRNNIRMAYFEDILRLPMLDRMTATEVLERRNDKLGEMSPYTSRIQEELLDPLIGVTISGLIRRNKLPPPPESLSRSGIGVEYISPLAISQRASRINAFQVWMNSLLPLAQMDPTVLAPINTAEVPYFIGEALNIPPQLIRPREDVAAEIQAQKEKAAVDAAAESGLGIAETAKTAAEADAIAGRLGAA